MERGDDYIYVRLLSFDCEVKTTVWITDGAKKELDDFTKTNEGKFFAKKLLEVAKHGFDAHEGGVIRSEGNGVFRFGIKASLFRAIGYYGPNAFKEEFFILYAKFKPGQDRGARISAKVKEVARIRDSGRVRKVLR